LNKVSVYKIKGSTYEREEKSFIIMTLLPCFYASMVVLLPMLNKDKQFKKIAVVWRRSVIFRMPSQYERCWTFYLYMQISYEIRRYSGHLSICDGILKITAPSPNYCNLLMLVFISIRRVEDDHGAIKTGAEES